MKPLNNYLKTDENGCLHYEDEDGAYYDNLEDLLQIHVLGFCGCGLPTDNLKFIYDLLILKEEYKKDESNDSFTEYHKKLSNYIMENIYSVIWFMDYWLDNKSITTHGGNVSGGWIDDDNFFDALKLWHDEYKKQNMD